MIRFQTQAHADVVMFDDVARQLIQAMGHSGSVPGALKKEEVAAALNRLQQAMAQPGAQAGDDWEADAVSTAHRAQPLIDLLKAAQSGHHHVLWDTTLL
jgi:hypothetical protein